MVNECGGAAALGGRRRDRRAVELGGDGLVGIHHAVARIAHRDGKSVTSRVSRNSAEAGQSAGNCGDGNVVNVLVLVRAAGASGKDQPSRAGEEGGLVIAEDL